MRLRTVVATCAAAGAGAMALPSVPAMASATATGDPATIAFYRTVAAATAARPGLTEVVSGYSSVRESTSLPVSWLQNEAPPASYKPFIDHVTIGSKAGKLLWLSDVLTPQPGCKPTSAHECEPLHLELTAKGLFYQIGTGCAGPAHGSVFLFSSVGGASGYKTEGHFLPMVRKGANVVVTSTFQDVGAQVATELDTISYATRLPSLSVVHLGKAKGRAAFTYTSELTWLSKKPALPVMRLCAGGTT